MSGFLFRLETTDGTPVEPPMLTSAVPNWRPGDTIPLGHRTLRVVGVRDEGADLPTLLVVEDTADPGQSWCLWCPKRAAVQCAVCPLTG